MVSKLKNTTSSSAAGNPQNHWVNVNTYEAEKIPEHCVIRIPAILMIDQVILWLLTHCPKISIRISRLVLTPIERMISKLDKIRNNPLEAMTIGLSLSHFVDGCWWYDSPISSCVIMCHQIWLEIPDKMVCFQGENDIWYEWVIFHCHVWLPDGIPALGRWLVSG